MQLKLKKKDRVQTIQKNSLPQISRHTVDDITSVCFKFTTDIKHADCPTIIEVLYVPLQSVHREVLIFILSILCLPITIRCDKTF